MTYYLPESRFLEIGKTQFLPIAADAASQTHGNKHLVDSISSCQKHRIESQDAVLKILPATARASLPEPQGKVFPDIMDLAAEAFCESFDAIDKGILTQSVDYTSLQQLSSVQSQCILQSSTIAIKKEADAQALQAQIDQYSAEMSSAMSTTNWVMAGLGIALMALTVITGFFDFGASDAALPEEAELVNGYAADSEDAFGEGGEAIEDAEASAKDAINTGESTTSSTQQTAQATANTVTKTTQANTITWRSVLNTIRGACTSDLGRVSIRMGIAAAFGSPILINGFANLSISQQLAILSKVQSDSGDAQSQLQRNNMFYQFYQQLLQRMGGALREETTDASEIVETYGSITNAYRQISFGLANAV